MSGGVVAKDELGGWRSLDPELLRANGHSAIGADSDGRTQTPDERPPRAAWDRTQDAALFLLSQVPGLLRFHLQFAVNFVLIAVQAQVVDMRVGLVNLADAFAGEVSWQALLPEEMTSFHLALGLRGRSVTETDAVEVQGLAQLGERFGFVGA